MRLAAALVALTAAVLRPPEWQLSLPGQQPGLVSLVEKWFSAPRPAAAKPAPHDESDQPTCVCDCPAAEHLEPTLLAWAFAAGIAAWPAADVVRLCKLAWHRQVAAAERALQLRAPDRP